MGIAVTKASERMTKGKALIEARDLFGNEAHVQLRGRDHVVLDSSGLLVGDGRDWDEALRSAMKTWRKRVANV